MKNQTKSNLQILLQLRMFFPILLFLVSSILIASCNAGSNIPGRETSNSGNNKSAGETSNAGNSTPESEAARLNTNRDEWRKSRNTLNYRMTIKVMQPGYEGVGGVFVVTVRNGRAESVKKPNPSDLKNPDYLPRRITEYDTIEKLFGIIEKSISPKPDKLIVEYNEYYEYPEKFELDKTLSGNDDELEFEVLELYTD